MPDGANMPLSNILYYSRNCMIAPLYMAAGGRLTRPKKSVFSLSSFIHGHAKEPSVRAPAACMRPSTMDELNEHRSLGR